MEWNEWNCAAKGNETALEQNGKQGTVEMEGNEMED